MATNDLREWAIKGAERRLVEITGEAKAIFSLFPELRAQGRGFLSARGAEVSAADAGDKQRQAGGRRKRTMSAEARKRIGDAQRKRWAAVKANNPTAKQPATPAAKPTVRGSRKKR